MQDSKYEKNVKCCNKCNKNVVPKITNKSKNNKTKNIVPKITNKTKKRKNLTNVVTNIKSTEFTNLEPWEITDFDAVNEWPDNLDVTKKGFMYDSDLALNGDVYKIPISSAYPINPYYVRNLRTDFSDPGSGVPGPYEYSKDFSHWGGDDKFQIGTQFYGILLAHFGHTHILALHSKIASKRRDFLTSTKSQDMILEHLAAGSVQIFSKYASLVDLKGNKIDYTLPGVHPDVAKLMGMMDMLISGAGTTDAIINTDRVISAFKGFINNLADQMGVSVPPPSIGSPKSGGNPLQGLVNEVETLDKFLRDVLRMDAPLADTIPFMAWGPLMEMHQIGMYKSYEYYRAVYNCNKNRKEYAGLVSRSNMHTRHMYDGGRQLAAFFGLFYSATSFLDQFLTFVEGGLSQAPELPPGITVPTDSAIPDGKIRVKRVKYIHDTMKRYWMEHVTMFEDYDKASAFDICDEVEKKLYEIELSMLESCGTLACSLGEVFRAFDTLIRHRQLYEKFSLTPQ